MLAERLKRLEQHGLVAKAPYGNHRGRFDYALTDKGRSLSPVLADIVRWGLENIDGTGLPPKAQAAFNKRRSRAR